VAFGLDSKQLEIFRDPKILKKKLFFKNAKTKNEQFCFIGNQFLTQIIPSRLFLSLSLRAALGTGSCGCDRDVVSLRRSGSLSFPFKTSSSGSSPAMFDHFL
jgi:hypothetical protein